MERQEAFAMLVAAAPEIYNGNKEKGFWDDQDAPYKKEEKLMLILSEAGEALEAHRGGKTLRMDNLNYMAIAFAGHSWGDNPESIIQAFKDNVKDTYQDEIADIAIRFLDFIGAYGIVPRYTPFHVEYAGNFGADLFRLIANIGELHSGSFISSVERAASSFLVRILMFCEQYNIDLIQHVQWKLAYNKTRSHRHGKAY